jgi:putative copper export protein
MYTVLLFIHFVGLAMGVGTGFAMLRIGFANRHLSPPEKGQLFQKISALRLNGYTGFALLILSGVLMLSMRPGMASAAGPLFLVKMTLVVLMLVNMGVMHVVMFKAKRAGGPPPALLPRLGNLNFTMGVVTILVAVMVFH